MYEHFLSLTIEYQIPRSKEYIRRLQETIRNTQDWNNNTFTSSLSAPQEKYWSLIEQWTEKLPTTGLSTSESDKSDYLSLVKAGIHDANYEEIREIVLLARSCLQSRSVLQHCYGQKGLVLWRLTRFLARPLTICRTLRRVGERVPELRNFVFRPYPPPAPVKLAQDSIVSVVKAWRLLNLPENNDTFKNLQSWDVRFKTECSRGLPSHTEVQLLTRYLDNPGDRPVLDYFGCSKKACLLCEAILRLSPLQIRMRKGHGKCSPKWGIPAESIPKTESILRGFEQILVQRIKELLSNGPNKTKILRQPDPDSTLLSSLEE